MKIINLGIELPVRIPTHRHLGQNNLKTKRSAYVNLTYKNFNSFITEWESYTV